MTLPSTILTALLAASALVSVTPMGWVNVVAGWM